MGTGLLRLGHACADTQTVLPVSPAPSDGTASPSPAARQTLLLSQEFVARAVLEFLSPPLLVLPVEAPALPGWAQLGMFRDPLRVGTEGRWHGVNAAPAGTALEWALRNCLVHPFLVNKHGQNMGLAGEGHV